MEKKNTTPTKPIVKKRKGLPRTNNPIILPDGLTYLKQPNTVTMMSADYNAMHYRILITVIEYLQKVIEESINKTPTEQLSLFKETVDDARIKFTIPFSAFGVAPQNYKHLRKYLKLLASIPVEFNTLSPLTGNPCWAVSGLFTAYIEKKKNINYVEIEIHKDIAKTLVCVDGGYTKYIKEIAFNSQSRYTIKMYMFISSWKDKGGRRIYLEDFRKLFYLQDKYPTYKELYKRVIRQAYEELFEKANCWFEVSEEYKPGESEPYLLDFKIIKAALTIQEKERLKMQSSNIETLCTKYLGMKKEHIDQILPLVNIMNSVDILNKITDLIEYIRQNHDTITNIPNYCVISIKKEFTPYEEENENERG